MIKFQYSEQRRIAGILDTADKKLESVYIETIKLLNEWGDTKLIEKSRPRLEILVNQTENVGWGYHDVLWDWYDEL